MMVRRATLIGGVLLAAACVERVSAPGQCPSFCPSGQIQIVDTVLTSIISRDSSFRGYVTALHAPQLLAADLPGFVDGRAIFRFNGYGQRYLLAAADTGTILGADSARLQLTLARPGRKDTITGDSAVVDTLNHVVVLQLKFDTAAARYVGTDSGTVAYGIRVSADSLASIAIPRASLVWHWYLQVDSAGTPVAR